MEREISPEELAAFQQEIEMRKRQNPQDGTLIQVDISKLSNDDCKLWEGLKEIVGSIDVSFLDNKDLQIKIYKDLKKLLRDNDNIIISKKVLEDKMFNAWIRNKVGAIYTNLDMALSDDELEDDRIDDLSAAVIFATMINMSHPAGLKLLNRQLRKEQFSEEVGRVKIKDLNPEKLELLSDFFVLIDEIKAVLNEDPADEQKIINILKKTDELVIKIAEHSLADRCRDVVDMIRNQLVTLKGKLELFINKNAKPDMKKRMVDGILTNINRWD